VRPGPRLGAQLEAAPAMNGERAEIVSARDIQELADSTGQPEEGTDAGVSVVGEQQEAEGEHAQGPGAVGRHAGGDLSAIGDDQPTDDERDM